MEGLRFDGGRGPGAVLPPRGLELGAHFDGQGTNFAVYAAEAAGVQLVLLSPDRRQVAEYPLADHRHHIWGAYLPGVRPGQRYGYRVSGTWAPWRGLRHNPAKLLLDPYARAIDAGGSWDESLLDFDPVLGVNRRSEIDSLFHAPLGVVTGPDFDWEGDVAPCIDDSDLLIYETHVRGFTRRYPFPAKPGLRAGTYAALARPPMTQHLRRVGATAVELLPVQTFLFGRGANYWGYNPIGYFAPEPGYASAPDPLQAVREYKQMVKELHASGIAVILDVVYNHTLEGGEKGPSISFKGLDNRTYYLLGDNGQYVDWTGCGNTVNATHPQVVKLILDSLRYWVTEMHVDGFRFDEAPVLGRRPDGAFEARAAFLAAVHADPVLSRVRLIAEPWDCFPTRRGDGAARNSFQLGGFPAPWQEWNAVYRDRIRDFWRGQLGIGDLARALSGSEEIFGPSDRGPDASINMITCHDGFTLRDLVSYDQKHNLANGENNRDGVNENHSWNCGVEGEVAPGDPRRDAILELRARQQRNFLATLYLSIGTPMLLGGDELNRTQGGNNNAYNQDNETSWFDWENADPELLRFVEKLARLRRDYPVLRQTDFLRGRSSAAGPNCLWLADDGSELGENDWRWRDGSRKSLGMLLDGDEPLLLLFHAGSGDVNWKLPSAHGEWEMVLDTARPDGGGGNKLASGATLGLSARSVVVLRQRRQPGPDVLYRL